MQPLGSWRPDYPNLNSVHAREALNVLPGEGGYLPWRQLATSSPAVAAAVRGAKVARSTTGAIQIFGLTAAAAYKFAGVNTAWTDVTRAAGGAYSLATDEFWQLVQYGPDVIATQRSDVIQSIDASTGTNFAALAGSPPQAAYICIIGGFVMLGDISTDRKGVRWSGREAPTSWTVGTRDADFQTFPDGGLVMGLVGLEQAGLVFQQDAVRRMVTRPDRAIFDFKRLEGDVEGTSAPYSIIPTGSGAVYYGTRGFARIGLDGQTVPIGEGWVDAWFRENSNTSRLKAIYGAGDPTRHRFFWLFPQSGTTSTTMNRCICFDLDLVGSQHGPWSHAEFDATIVFPAASPGVTLAELAAIYADLATVPEPLGSDVWRGGTPGLAAFNSAHKLSFFSGDPMAATIQTPLFQPIPGRRSFVNGFRFIGDAATASGRIAVSETPQSEATFGAAQAVNAYGIVPQRASGRYMAAEVTIPAGIEWSSAQGIDLDETGLVRPAGKR